MEEATTPLTRRGLREFYFVIASAAIFKVRHVDIKCDQQRTQTTSLDNRSQITHSEEEAEIEELFIN